MCSGILLCLVLIIYEITQRQLEALYFAALLSVLLVRLPDVRQQNCEIHACL